MEITLYNTDPLKYKRKFSKILKKIIGPAIRAGKSVKVDEIKEAKEHMMPNYRKRGHPLDIYRRSDLTMKITIRD